MFIAFIYANEDLQCAGRVELSKRVAQYGSWLGFSTKPRREYTLSNNI